ncbi:MAG: sigma-70 family RNA polymerase sigma factor [Bacteroidota bacterium]
MSLHSDHKYIEAFRKGDYRLLDELYEKNVPQVKRWILNNSGTVEDAKDIFQETIISIIRKAHDPDFQLTYPIGGLIFQISKNKWMDELRKKKTQKKVRNALNQRLEDREEAFTLLLEKIEQDELLQRKLDSSFDLLSDHCQRLLKLFAKGAKPKEIVAILDMNNVNTVYRRKNACLQRWKELFNA